MLRIATLPFAIAPREALRPSERRVVDPLEDGSPSGEPPFLLALSDAPVCASEGLEPLAGGRAAHVVIRSDRVLLANPSMSAEIDPFGATGRLYRTGDDDVAIHLALTAAACCRLPLAGGAALHSAVLARGEDALLFFGPSGAGKTTLARSAPFPVLSDELNVVFERLDGWEVRCLGFWGTQNAFDAPRGGFRLRGLVELAKGEFALAPLDAAAALRALVGMVRLPLVDALWRLAFPFTARLAAAVPAWRMRWTPDDPPWRRLDSLFEGESPPV